MNLNDMSELKIKENNIQKNFAKVRYSAKSIPCDKNRNGNLSFFECYGCFKEATEVKDTFGNWWCDGWASCWASISVSCAILSNIY